MLTINLSSPRTWRCFHARSEVADDARVFSTYVEVFLQTG